MVAHYRRSGKMSRANQYVKLNTIAPIDPGIASTLSIFIIKLLTVLSKDNSPVLWNKIQINLGVALEPCISAGGRVVD
jgi:hypothetical protein